MSSMMAMVANLIRGRGVAGNALRPHRSVAGSTPAGSTRALRVAAAATVFDNPNADVAQVVEHPAEDRGVPRPTRGVGTALAVLRSFRVPALRGLINAGVAQLAERLPRKQRVAGSKPVAGPVGSRTTRTTGTTTTNGSVPEWSKGRGRNPRSLALNTPGSNPGRPTSLTAGGSYPEREDEDLGPVNNYVDEPMEWVHGPDYERVAEMVQASVCNTDHRGSNPLALSGRKDPESCCGAMVQRHEHPVVAREAGVRLPLAPLPQAADQDTLARGRHPFAGGARLVERRLAKAEAAGSNPVSRSDMPGRGRGGAGGARLVERQPSKLDVAGSNPVSRSRSSRSVSSIVVI